MPYTTPAKINTEHFSQSFITHFENRKNIAGYFKVSSKVRNILKYHPDQIIAFENDPIKYLYEIIAGTVKTYKILNDGRRQITDFYTKGDVIGLPVDGRYFHTIEAITEASICCHSKIQMKRLMDSDPDFTLKIIKSAHDRLSDAHEQMISLGRKTPDERIAAFLLKCQKWATIQIPAQNFIINLPMSRVDIADYTGLRQETVCRIFSKFKRAGLITLLRSDQLILNDHRQLLKLANLSEDNSGTIPRYH